MTMARAARKKQLPKAQRPRNDNKFWSMRAETTETGENVGHLYLYGEIESETWWGDEVTPQTFQDDLNDLGNVSILTVHIFSGGGDVFAGFAIYSKLKQHSAKKVIYIEGLAASMATVVAMAGDEIYISSVAQVMIHNPAMTLWGYYKADDLKKLASDLEHTRESMVGAYADKTGLTRDEVIEIMDGEDGQGTWFTASEAIEAALVDDYIPDESEEALGAVASLGGDTYERDGVQVDLSIYPNAPKLLERRSNAMSKAARAARASKSRKTVKAVLKRVAEVQDEVVTVSCPECDVEFDAEIPDDAEGTVEITCPECNATFDYEVDGEVEEDPEDDPEGNADPEDDPEEDAGTEGQDAVSKAVQKALAADRKRIADLDQLALIHPEQADIVEKAKASGDSYDKTCRKVMQAVIDAETEADAQAAGSGKAFLDNAKKDGKKTGKVGVSPNSGAGQSGSTANQGVADSLAIFNGKSK
jgi:ATP-dependent Clp protease protease subunit